jgi:hypothetical protein
MVNKVDWYSQNVDAVDNTGTKHYDDAVRLLATSDREIYDGDETIIREQQEIIRLLREQNEALQREVVVLSSEAQRSGARKVRDYGEGPWIWQRGYDFRVSQRYTKHGRICRCLYIQFTELQFSMTFIPLIWDKQTPIFIYLNCKG